MRELSLNNIQSSFSRMISEGQSETGFIEKIIPGGSLSNEEAIAVYQQAYKARFTDVLGETFESVWWVLGDTQFFEVAHAYIYTHFENVYNLSEYGKKFPEFLSKNLLLKTYPFLADLANFEWTFKELFHEEDARGMNAEDLMGTALDGAIILRFKKACILFSSDYDVVSIWDHRKDQSKEGLHIHWQNKINCMMYKYNKEIFIKKLEAFEFQLLTYLHLGNSLEASLELLYSNFPSITSENISNLFSFLSGALIIEKIE